MHAWSRAGSGKLRRVIPYDNGGLSDQKGLFENSGSSRCKKSEADKGKPGHVTP